MQRKDEKESSKGSKRLGIVFLTTILLFSVLVVGFTTETAEAETVTVEDGFEDQDMSEYTEEIESGNSQYYFKSDNPTEGSYYLMGNYSGSGESDIVNYTYNAWNGTTDREIRFDYSLGQDASTETTHQVWYIFRGLYVKMGINFDGTRYGDLIRYSDGTVLDSISSPSYSANTWYDCNISSQGSDVEVVLEDDNGYHTLTYDSADETGDWQISWNLGSGWNEGDELAGFDNFRVVERSIYITDTTPTGGDVVGSTDVTLESTVNHSQGESMDVEFRNASDDSLIGEHTGVSNGTYTADWNDLQENREYSWYVNVTSSSETSESLVYDFVTKYAHNPPQPISPADLVQYDESTGNANVIHDLVNDTANRSEIKKPPDSGESGWRAGGAPSITDNGTHYLMLNRMRWGDTSRGEEYHLSTCPMDKDLTDINNWSLVWSADNSEMGGLDSVEAGTLRYWDGVYHMYFSADEGGWSTQYVNSTSVSGLYENVTDQSEWVGLNGNKDVWVGRLNGKYILMQEIQASPNEHKIFIDDDPSFSSKDEKSSYTGTDNQSFRHANFMMYDNSTSQYIAVYDWYSHPHVGFSYVVSDDLENWEVVGEETLTTQSEITSDSGNLRYGDYYSPSDRSGYYFLLEYDHDRDSESSTMIWDYTYLEDVLPEISNPSPVDAKRISRSPKLSVDISHPNGQLMNATFYDASDDSQIGQLTDLNDGRVELEWGNLGRWTEYSWYVEVDSAGEVVTSDTHTLTTDNPDATIDLESDTASWNATAIEWAEDAKEWEMTVDESTNSSITVHNLSANTEYEIYIDGGLHETLTTDGDGNLNVTYDEWSTHTFTVEEYSEIESLIEEIINLFISIIPIIIIISVISMIVKVFSGMSKGL